MYDTKIENKRKLNKIISIDRSGRRTSLRIFNIVIKWVPNKKSELPNIDKESRFAVIHSIYMKEKGLYKLSRQKNRLLSPILFLSPFKNFTVYEYCRPSDYDMLKAFIMDTDLLTRIDFKWFYKKNMAYSKLKKRYVMMNYI